MEREWREHDHVTECYGGGQFNGGRMVLLRRWTNRESMIVREVVKLMEVEWSCYGGGQVEGE